MSGLFGAIQRHAAAATGADAVVGSHAATLGWAGLAEAVSDLAASLRRRFDGSRPLATLFDHGIAGCIADLALIEAEIPSIPLPAFFTPAQRDHAIAASGAVALMRAAEKGMAGAFDVSPVASAPVELPAGTAKISFTSGSTGTPKGICLSSTHMLGVAGSVVDFLGSAYAGRHLALLPPGILLENVAGFYATLLAGGTYVALDQAEVGMGNPFLPDFLRMTRAIAECGITSLILAPEYLLGLVSVMQTNGVRLPDLRLVAVGGARLAPSLIDRATAVGLPVRQGYGLTECASVVTLEAAEESERGSVGRSIGLNRIRIAEDGEILLEGTTCLGTIGGPVARAPFRTGDVGRLDGEGRLWIEGRKSNLIVTSHGRNISPEWVEATLLAEPAVAQAMVFGDGAAVLGAIVVPAAADADIASAIESANAHLPAYARIARWSAAEPFTANNGLLTGNGRLQREAIGRQYLEGCVS